MRDYFAQLWLTLRNRPIFLLGAMAGLLIFVLLIQQGIQIRNRTIRVEANTPCLNLTTRECAHKLLNSLAPTERVQIQRRYVQDVRRRARVELRRQERQRRLRTTARRRARDRRSVARPGGEQGSPGRRSPSTSPGGGTSRPGSSPSPNPPASSAPSPSPPPAAPSSPQRPAPAPVQAPQPIIQTPSITTPQIGPVAPVTIPTVSVPCVPVPPLVNCNS